MKMSNSQNNSIIGNIFFFLKGKLLKFPGTWKHFGFKKNAKNTPNLLKTLNKKSPTSSISCLQSSSKSLHTRYLRNNLKNQAFFN